LEEVARLFEEGLEDIPTLLAGGRDDGSKAGEGLGAGHGAEAAGCFHPDLHHPRALLGLIVGEGDGEVIGEAQTLIEEIAAWEHDRKANRAKIRFRSIRSGVS